MKIYLLIVFLASTTVLAQAPTSSNSTINNILPHTGVLFVKQLSNVNGQAITIATYFGAALINIAGALLVIIDFKPKDDQINAGAHLIQNAERTFLITVLGATSVFMINNFFVGIAEAFRNLYNIPADAKGIRINADGSVATN